jgi:hypothetical protein
VAVDAIDRSALALFDDQIDSAARVLAVGDRDQLRQVDGDARDLACGIADDHAPFVEQPVDRRV